MLVSPTTLYATTIIVINNGVSAFLSGVSVTLRCTTVTVLPVVIILALVLSPLVQALDPHESVCQAYLMCRRRHEVHVDHVRVLRRGTPSSPRVEGPLDVVGVSQRHGQRLQRCVLVGASFVWCYTATDNLAVVIDLAAILRPPAPALEPPRPVHQAQILCRRPREVHADYVRVLRRSTPSVLREYPAPALATTAAVHSRRDFRC